MVDSAKNAMTLTLLNEGDSFRHKEMSCNFPKAISQRAWVPFGITCVTRAFERVLYLPVLQKHAFCFYSNRHKYLYSCTTKNRKKQAIGNYLTRYVILPLVRSYGDSSTLTWSPGRMRI